jgi:DNA polymerase-3 subunit alpha
MEKAGGYSFNKSHSACYSFLAFQTAYLKAHYPEAYMAALMSSVMNTKDRVPQYVAEARAMSIEVLPPDVNESGHRFTVVGETIRFGLSAVKNVGGNFVEAVIAAREKDGPFEDLFDLCARVDCKTYNKRTIESLIKCGAFDSLGHSRAALLEVHEGVELAQNRQGQTATSSACSGGGTRDSPAQASIRVETTARHLSGRRRPWLYVSTTRCGPCCTSSKSTPTHVSELGRMPDGAVCGSGARDLVRRNTTRKGDMMAMLQLDDTRGLAEVMVFPRVYAKCATCVREDAILKVKGRVERKEGIPRVVALEIEELDLQPGLDPSTSSPKPSLVSLIRTPGKPSRP